jgi:hypothetical protein
VLGRLTLSIMGLLSTCKCYSQMAAGSHTSHRSVANKSSQVWDSRLHSLQDVHC